MLNKLSKFKRLLKLILLHEHKQYMIKVKPNDEHCEGAWFLKKFIELVKLYDWYLPETHSRLIKRMLTSKLNLKWCKESKDCCSTDL